MRLKLACLATLLLKTTAIAQSASPDSQMNQAILVEVRQLRQDLQNAAAIIQRVQIAMYRLQAEATLLDRASQRLDQARASCMGSEWQRKTLTAQREQVDDARKRNSQSSSDQNAAEAQLSQINSTLEQLASQERQCQVEQVDAEAQFRVEQAKLNDLQDQLEKLDKALSDYGRR
jgi:chromosome segregation ATPase